LGSTEYPAGLGIYSRIEREWKITNTAFDGTFSIDVTLNTSPITASHLRILISDTEILTNATMHNPNITVSGSTVTISGLSNVEIPLNSTRYLTIVSMNSLTPLPIDLIQFDAVNIDNVMVKLNWVTTSEKNNESFTIEHSMNTVDWEGFHKIEGAGNSSSFLSYVSFDENPFVGISYYRLKQTDFDGEFSYSPMRSVNIEMRLKSHIEIYPNPTNNKITIVGNKFKLEQIRIYNVLGENVTKHTTMLENNKTKVVLDLSGLNTGIYYVKTKTIAKKIYKQ